MVCRPKAQREINEVLGVRATVSDRTWVDHKYSCRYGYPNGSFELSVKELSSWPQTLAYFHELGAQMGDPQTLGNLGQGAFRTSGGDVVVRKDWKVLLVDVSGLPSQFGVPPTERDGRGLHGGRPHPGLLGRRLSARPALAVAWSDVERHRSGAEAVRSTEAQTVDLRVGRGDPIISGSGSGSPGGDEAARIRPRGRTHAPAPPTRPRWSAAS